MMAFQIGSDPLSCKECDQAYFPLHPWFLAFTMLESYFQNGCFYQVSKDKTLTSSSYADQLPNNAILYRTCFQNSYR